MEQKSFEFVARACPRRGIERISMQTLQQVVSESEQHLERQQPRKRICGYLSMGRLCRQNHQLRMAEEQFRKAKDLSLWLDEEALTFHYVRYAQEAARAIDDIWHQIDPGDRRTPEAVSVRTRYEHIRCDLIFGWRT